LLHSFEAWFSFITHCIHIPSRTPLAICIFIFAEEDNSSSPNIQYIFLASVNFLFFLPRSLNLGCYFDFQQITSPWFTGSLYKTPTSYFMIKEAVRLHQKPNQQGGYAAMNWCLLFVAFLFFRPRITKYCMINPWLIIYSKRVHWVDIGSSEIVLIWPPVDDMLHTC